MLKSPHSLFWKTLAAFLLFAFVLSCFFGYFIFLTAERFGVFLVQEQVAPVMIALVESEKQHRVLKDNFHTKNIAQSINGEFYVGKKVPDDIRELGYGLHLDGSDFIYVVNDDGIMYALTGSSKAFQTFLSDISGVVLLGCCLGIVLATIIALLLSRQLSSPLINLAKSIQNSTPAECSIPLELTDYKDEIGLVASTILEFQKDAREYYQREANFAGDVSHELLTPLAVISGSVEILGERLKNRASLEKEHLERIERSVRQMTSSVRSVLALARKNPPEATYIDMNEILNTEIERLKSIGICGKTEITIHARNNVPAYGHVEMASTVLGNILANACKHGAGNHVQARIGSRFVSICNDSMSDVTISSGYGLGLSIAVRCCEKMGWQLRIRSNDAKMMIRISWPGTSNSNHCGEAKFA